MKILTLHKQYTFIEHLEISVTEWVSMEGAGRGGEYDLSKFYEILK